MKYIYTQQNSQGMVEENEHYVDEVNIVNEPRRILEDIGSIIGHVTGDGYPAEGGSKLTATNVVKNNFNAEALPTVSDDETKGYSKGSIWVYQGVYVCLDSTTGSANWQIVGGSSVQTEDITLYCDYNSESGDGTQSNPFKTLQEAIDSLPTIITKEVTINILSNETVEYDKPWGDFKNLINQGEIKITGMPYISTVVSVTGKTITVADNISGDLTGMILAFLDNTSMFSYTVQSNTTDSITVEETITTVPSSSVGVLVATEADSEIINFTGKGQITGIALEGIQAKNSNLVCSYLIGKYHSKLFEIENSNLSLGYSYANIKRCLVDATDSFVSLAYVFGMAENTNTSIPINLVRSMISFQDVYLKGQNEGYAVISAFYSQFLNLSGLTYLDLNPIDLTGKYEKIIVNLAPDTTTIEGNSGDVFITGQNTQATEITSINGNGIITIIGGAGTIPSTMNPSTTFILSSVMTFDENDSLTLIKVGSKFIELARSVK